MSNIIKNFQIFENVSDSDDRSVSNKDIYQEQIDAGKTPEQAAEFLLDILTNGIWVGWDSSVIEEFKNKLIAKYSE